MTTQIKTFNWEWIQFSLALLGVVGLGVLSAWLTVELVHVLVVFAVKAGSGVGPPWFN